VRFVRDGLWFVGLALLLSPSGCTHRAASTGEAPAVAAGAAAPALAPAALARDTDADKILVTETEYQGWRYFQVYCARCHGEDALGSLTAPDLTFSVSSDGSITRDSFVVVARGGSANKEMKGFQDLLDDQQILNIYAYVKARSEGRLGRGRPHRATTNP
jgi:mono/diheme cytochrome c family protein